MKVVDVHAQVNMELCQGCKTCEMVCPVYAVKVKKKAKDIQVDIDLKKCVGCWNCEQRCPDHAIEMVPCEPYVLETDVSQFNYQEIEALCKKARFHPKQGVCYCTGSRAEELAAAILGGAKTPDAVVLATGIGAGCGIECNQPVQRFLEAAGHRYERPKSSWQWYGRTVTVWEVSPDVKGHYPVFRFEDDRELLDRRCTRKALNERLGTSTTYCNYVAIGDIAFIRPTWNNGPPWPPAHRAYASESATCLGDAAAVVIFRKRKA